MDTTSPGLPKPHSHTTPLRRQSSNQTADPAFGDAVTGATYFSMSGASSLNQSVPNRPLQNQFLDPTSSSFVSTYDGSRHGRSSRHNSDEENMPPVKNAFGGIDSGLAFQTARQNYYNGPSGTTSTAASRSGSLPPSRNGYGQPTRFVEDMIRQPNPALGSNPSHRPNLSAHGSLYPTQNGAHAPKASIQSTSGDLGNLVSDFGRVNLGRTGQNMQYGGQKDQQFNGQDEAAYQYNQQINNGHAEDLWADDTDDYQAPQDAFPEAMPQGAMAVHGNPYRNVNYGGAYAHSPSSSDARRSQHSPYYSSNATPSSGVHPRVPSRGGYNGTVTTGQAALLDRKLRGLQQEQQGFVSYQPNPMHLRSPYANPYDFQPQQALRMNHLNPSPFYPVPTMPNFMTNQSIPRGPAKDQDPGIGWRSALLEEFRGNNKINKRYELKVRPISFC